MEKNNEPLSEIQRFYEDSNVFVTGATGFIGHLLIEKLLRSCKINKLFLLVRSKENKEPTVRLREMFSSTLFERLWNEQPDFIRKVFLIQGDCVEPNLGLSVADVEYLVANMDIVIHCATTINFNGPLKHTGLINVRSTRDLLFIARRMDRLKAFVYVSTVFSNPNQPVIDETIHDCQIKGDMLINMVENMSDSLIDSITPECLGTWPNTYTLSKCVAENIIKQYGQNMPICIARPAMVLFTDKEPVSGWATGLKNLTGLCLGLGLGIIRVLPGKRYVTLRGVPADKVANMIITSAWNASKTRSKSSIPVFNYVQNNTASRLIFGQTMDYIVDSISRKRLTSEKQVWKPSVTIISSNVLYTILFFLYHYVPAALADIYLWITGKKTKVVGLCKKLDIMIREIKYFMNSEFKFDNKHLQALIMSQSDEDKKLFAFDLSGMEWETYLMKSIHGSRKYVIKDPEDTTESQKRYQKILITYYIFHAILNSCILYVFYSLLKIIFTIS